MGWRHHNTAAIYNAPYGPNDNFDLLFSNVLLAVLANIHAAMRKRRNTVEIWGSGPPRREFFHVDDLADAVVFLMKTCLDEEPSTSGQARM